MCSTHWSEGRNAGGALNHRKPRQAGHEHLYHVSLDDTFLRACIQGIEPVAEELYMPTVLVEGQFRFVVNTRERVVSNRPTYTSGLPTQTYAAWNSTGVLAWTRLRLEPSETT